MKKAGKISAPEVGQASLVLEAVNVPCKGEPSLGWLITKRTRAKDSADEPSDKRKRKLGDMQMKPEGIDWGALVEDFEEFELDGEALKIQGEPFALSLVSPLPRFVRFFLEGKFKDDSHDPERVKVLFFFLLNKRYTDRINLLHFAFNIFDDDCHLPDELVAQVPFPHEDGVPRYAFRLDPNYEY
jgi:hypothetical protein